ncbi:MAG: helicase, partial [Marmoricola sp.]|nr:helicase [Marmoricola sp.]
MAAREIAREQEYVDTVYAQLDKATASAQELAREGLARGRIGNEGGLVERDAMVFQAARRMATLDAAHEGLVFGRLDMRSDVSTAPRYIGRIGLRDDDYELKLIDWRAPAARPFYAATPRNPEGLVRRRHIYTRRRTVTGVDDEVFNLDKLS